MHLIVNTSAYVAASAELYSAQVFVHQALDGLGSGLAGAAQMAGNDDAGVKFAHDYDDAARNLVGGITDSLTGAGVLSRLLADTANVWADAEHYASGGVASLGLAASAADTSDLSVTCSVVSPTALGGRTDFVPEGWEWVQSVVGAVWPNGDTGKLRSAQEAWERAGDDLRSASWKVDAAGAALAGLVTPELGLVQAKLDQYRGYLNDLSASAYALGQGCTSYAEGIEEAHTAIINELQELLITTVALEAGAALLAVFTVGASEVVGNAALMARIGLTGARVSAMIARLVEVAATVGARLAGITAAITRTLGLLRELKVVKVLTYLGTKAPAPIRAMTGISFNSAVSVGVDAAMHGGTPANAAHAILLDGISPVGVGAAVNSFKAGTRAAIDAEKVAVAAEGGTSIAGKLPGWMTEKTPQWIKNKLISPAMKPFEEKIWLGQAFNYENRARYPLNELVLSNGKRLDSYIPGEEIISRKYTQLWEIQDTTALGYLKELQDKYAPGEIAARTGRPIDRKWILEVPPQINPIPQNVLDYATKDEITIRDISGKLYNDPYK
ncbi:WXG100-like domain-containing protein [Arthrobacter sp. 2MCAF14]|uniref:WXG100-like domain-containing protein n=1 Tax=Arthrobacter sp. 2MCAF14 TaxID=3232982 RepID=UPI003F92F112